MFDILPKVLESPFELSASLKLTRYCAPWHRRLASEWHRQQNHKCTSEENRKCTSEANHKCTSECSPSPSIWSGCSKERKGIGISMPNLCSSGNLRSLALLAVPQDGAIHTAAMLSASDSKNCKAPPPERHLQVRRCKCQCHTNVSACGRWQCR